jgi:AraC-like DNA-binding protein
MARFYQVIWIEQGEATFMVAYALGFSDDSNFYKFFFKHTSLTPLSFRRIYR